MPRKLLTGKCSVSDCAGPIWAKKLCQKHYMRWLRHGHVGDTRPVGWGKKSDHPLYESWTWAKRRNSLAPEWLDFWKFVEDVGERPTRDHFLRPLDTGELLSAKNFFWARKQGFVEWTPDRKAYAREYQRQYRRRAPENTKNTHLKKTYGIGYADYMAVHDAQGGVCAICGRAETHAIRGRVLDLAVDHCHKSKKIRALLCHACNTGIGSFREDASLMLKAVTYLEKHCAK